jgi:hypothetical protein
MKVLQGIANVLLSLLLFVCVVGLGLGITINSTALSSHFVTSQIDRLDVVALFNEEALPELQKSPELADHPLVITAIQTAVVKDSPAIKTAVNEAVTDAYAYLTKGGTLDLPRVLKTTVLDPALTISVINDVDFSPIIDDLLTSQLPLSSASIAGYVVNLTPYVDSITAVIQPYLKQQVAALLPGVYDYMLGYSSAFDTDIPITGILGQIQSSLKAAVLASPPSVLAGLPTAVLSPAFDVAWNNLIPMVPDKISLAEQFGISQPKPITQQLSDAENDLAQARQAVVEYQRDFRWLIGLTALIVICIVALNRDVKRICRIFGGVLVPVGALETAALLFGRALWHSGFADLSGVPELVRLWLLQLGDAVIKPALIFAIACLGVGILLLIFSLFWKSHKAETRKAAG